VNKIVSPIAALVALGIICGMVTVLVLKGHTDALTLVVTAVGGLILAISRVVRGNIAAPAPVDDAPPAPKPPSVPPIVGGLLFVLAVLAALISACTKQEEAKDAYSLASHACLQAYDDGAHQRDCLEYVRNRYTEAGAPPAAQLDGGSHE